MHLASLLPTKPLIRPLRRRRRIICNAVAPPWTRKTGRLALEDGTLWKGVNFGAKGTQVAEVVFNTSMTGYQEIMTDPSYKGQFVCFTYPHIGNVGTNQDDVESDGCHLGGIIVRNLSRCVSNYRSTLSLEEYCMKNEVVGIAELDTRALTKRIREKGALIGVISSDVNIDDDQLLNQAQSWRIEGKDLLKEVTSSKVYKWKDPTLTEWEHNENRNEKQFHVVAYDFGIKHNILRRLAAHGCDITVVPADCSAEEVLRLNPDGIFLSNGPGDPSAAPYAVQSARALIGKKPMFGICMGHQILGQAFGGSTFKLKFGHHGGNHPIRQLTTGRIEISAQNHNFAVDPTTLPEGVQVTHVNLNDGTCAGMLHEEAQVITIQYHPEASPGPHDADIVFGQFVEMMKQNKK
eukprot:g3116.t1